MSTENRSRNTEMVSVPEGFMLVERSIWTEQQVEAATACITRLKGVPGMRDCDLAMAAIDAAQCKAPDIALSDLLPAPLPHAEPIAWMVGTAFWWTKEEAERDAAETGLPVVAIGPVADPGEVERLKQELLVSRSQGRAEVVEMIAQLDAETGLDEFIGSHQIGCTGEWGSHWKEDTLRHHFDIDLGAASELERCRHSGYEIIILEEERDTLRAQLAERDALLRDTNKRHSSGVDFDLPADLAATVKALSASAEQSALTWACQLCQLEQPTDRPCDVCGGKTDPVATKP